MLQSYAIVAVATSTIDALSCTFLQSMSVTAIFKTLNEAVSDDGNWVEWRTHRFVLNRKRLQSRLHICDLLKFSLRAYGTSRFTKKSRDRQYHDLRHDGTSGYIRRGQVPLNSSALNRGETNYSFSFKILL